MNFSYKDIYLEAGKRVLEVNILPEKYCNFDCIFCPIGRSHHQVDTQQSFGELDSCLKELETMIQAHQVDLVLINSMGEALINNRIGEIIAFIKGKGVPVRLLSNGYLLGRREFMQIANQCDEVIGEIKVITEEHYQKVLRPLKGYTFQEHISNMKEFKDQYQGKFILAITIIKGYNDSEEAVQKIKHLIAEIAPDQVIVERMEDEPFKKKLGISDERFEEIIKVLQIH